MKRLFFPLLAILLLVACADRPGDGDIQRQMTERLAVEGGSGGVGGSLRVGGGGVGRSSGGVGSGGVSGRGSGVGGRFLVAARGQGQAQRHRQQDLVDRHDAYSSSMNRVLAERAYCAPVT